MREISDLMSEISDRNYNRGKTPPQSDVRGHCNARKCQCQADTATRSSLARHGPTRSRHGPAWRGLVWPIEVRGLADRSEGSGQQK